MSKLLDYTGLGRFLDKLKVLFIQKQPTATLGNITVFNGEGGVIDGGKSIALTLAVFFGTIDSTSTATALTATVNGLTEIVPGTTIYIYNGVISGSSSCTLNINNLGAFPIYRGGNEYSRVGFSKNHTWQLIYNPVRVTDGCWDMLYGLYSYVNLGYYDREASYSLIAKEEMKKPTYVFHYSETELVPLYNGTNFTTLDFDPFSKIYWLYTSNTAANASIASSDLYTRSNSGDLRSWVSEFTPHKLFFIKCIPSVDSNDKRTGRVLLAPLPFTLELPTTEDGFVYILMGVIGGTLYSLEFLTTHPIYEFKDGAIRLWTNAPTVDISGKADSATTLAGYGITDAKIENGTITLGSNSITPLTQHQNITGKEDSTNKVTSLSSSSTDTQYPSAKCVYDAINNINPRIPITSHGTSDTTFALTPNIYHKWGSVASLTLTLATPDDVSVMNEYIFSFTSPATPTTLSVPASVNWVTTLDIEANKEYRVSIIDNLATWITSDMVVPIGDVNTPEFATKAYVDAGLALKEDSSNKVTSVDENSTDTQYPSAKAMYDALNPE